MINSKGSSDLVALLEHPVLVSASLSFKAITENKFTISDTSSDEVDQKRHVYLFQREYATVDPTLVDVGEDNHLLKSLIYSFTYVSSKYISLVYLFFMSPFEFGLVYWYYVIRRGHLVGYL